MKIGLGMLEAMWNISIDDNLESNQNQTALSNTDNTHVSTNQNVELSEIAPIDDDPNVSLLDDTIPDSL
ncbi:MAG: hypothetical protein ATN31_01140 [Candidatus Epulonipiscioides saccharophilum]|nr:MAG: hypothetical protein ATN31_01140 [Epulopiscium sp. AS2M-Bin001]